jgi:hypothetical protein
MTQSMPINHLRISAQDTKNLAMSFPYTLGSSPDDKLESGEEQVQSK